MMPSRWGRGAHNIYHALLDLVFPPRCVVCRQVGEWLCPGCLNRIENVRPPWCSRCGRTIDASDCTHCQASPLQIDGLRSVAIFEGPMREAIHAFKFRHRVELAPVFGNLMHEYLSTWPLPFGVIMPIPLHSSREQERGYNQALLLAHELSVHERIPLWYNRIERTRATPPQTGLDARGRRENMRNAFEAIGRFDGVRALLVDDVCTTGATIEACGVALKRCGAESVWGLALARGR